MKEINYDLLQNIGKQLNIERANFYNNLWTIRVNPDSKEYGYGYGTEKQNIELISYAVSSSDTYELEQKLKLIKTIGGKYIKIRKSLKSIRFYLDVDNF